MPDAKGKWLPGESGNPAGSPLLRPKHRKVTEALDRLLAMPTAARKKYKPKNGYEELAAELLKSATKGDGKFKVKSHAQALIYNRIEGRDEPSEKEAEAMSKGARVIILDMPQPPALKPAQMPALPPALTPAEDKKRG